MLRPEAISLKARLYEQCLQYIDKCISNAQLALHDAMQSGATEVKSTAGDKHETGRALLQLEQEKHNKQLQEMTALKEKLIRIDPTLISETIVTGSVVQTTAGNFYIAIAAGKIIFDNTIYVAVSSSAPIALKMMGLKVNDKLDFNGTAYVIQSVF